MATAARFRRTALGMTDVVEGAHMGHPDFRVRGRIFATLQPGNRVGMVKLALDEQARFVREHGDAFQPAAGAWGRAGSTLVTLAAVDDETIGEALTLAWQEGVSARPARPPARRRR